MLEYILETLTVFTLDTIESLGYAGVFLLMALESANIPIPSEIIMPFSGFLVSTGSFNFWLVVFFGALGNLAGSLVSYFAASKLDRRIRKNRDFALAERWFKKYGDISMFFSRMLPIVRTFISFPAGMFKVNIWKFSAYTFAGSFLWSWLLTYIGFVLGENWQTLEPYFRQFDYVIVGIGVASFIWWIWHHKRRK